MLLRVDAAGRDVVFLYRSGHGIVAYGKAAGRLEQRHYHGDPQHAAEEWFRPLSGFVRLSAPLPAAEIKRITERNLSFRQTMAALAPEAGRALWDQLRRPKQAGGR